MDTIMSMISSPFGLAALGVAGGVGYFIRSLDPVARVRAGWAALTKRG